MNRAACLLFLSVLASAASCATPPVTFNHDIAPIVFRYCADCHRPGEAGPFSLLSYADVRSHARQIVAVTRSRYMPPWLPEPGDLKLAEARRLSDEQISLFQKWVAAGTPQGNPADLPPQPKYVPGWQLGKPDLVLFPQKPFLLPPSGSDTYWNFVLPIPIDRTRWLRAIEIRPGDKRIVHHANILVDRLGSAREMEKEPGAGFGGMEIHIESESFDPDSHLLFWKPGSVPTPEPDGMALRLDKGTDLVLNVHLQPSGKPESIRPSIGLYFTDQPATLHPMLLEIENDAALHIPAGSKNFVVSDQFVLPTDVDLLAIYPHAHYLGKELSAFATLPGGTTKTLIDIKRWDLNWQAVYRYAQPITLPKGTTIQMRYTYDNSEENFANPNHPPQLVQGGNRSRDEMAHLWLQVLPHQEAGSTADPRMILQEALSQHEVDKDPGNFEAQYNLAAMLRARGQLNEALTHYRAAVRIRPTNPVANNALGSALLATGNFPDAIQCFHVALQQRPNYFDAHYNLALALASNNDINAAVEQFRLSTQIHSDDANAHANLGVALAEVGRLQDAKLEFNLALKIEPNNQIVQANLPELERMIAKQP